MVALLTNEGDDPAKIIKRPSAATSASTALELAQKETEQIQETQLAHKAYVFQILCLVLITLPTVLYYSLEDQRTWLEHTTELVEMFTIEQLMIWFELSFKWPDFGFPAIQVTFTSTFVVMCLTVVGSYLMQALLECAGEPWFAMPDARPGVWEDRLVAAFSILRLVRGRVCVSVGSCAWGGGCEWGRGGNCSLWIEDTCHSHRE